jgi:hypothetical protein
LNQRRQGGNQRIYFGNSENALGRGLFFHHSTPEQVPDNPGATAFSKSVELEKLTSRFRHGQGNDTAFRTSEQQAGSERL